MVARPLIEAARAGETTSYEVQRRLRAGPRWLRATYVPDFDAQGRVQGIVVLNVDITERKETEQALEESRARLELLTDTMPLLVAHVDRDLRYLYVNQAYADYYHTSKAEIVGRRVAEVLPPERYRQARPHLEAVLAGERVEYENTARDADGQLRVLRARYVPQFDEHGQVKAFVAAIEDVTEQVEAGERLRDLARFPAENPRPVLRVAQDGTLLYANPAAWPLLDLWKCEVGGQLAERWLHLLLVASGDEQPVEVECGGRRFALTCVPIRERRYINVYGEDITRRRQAEEHAERRLERQLAISEAALALGQASALRDVYRRFRACVARTMDADALIVSSYDPATHELRAEYAVCNGAELDVTGFPPIPLEPEGQGTQSRVIRSGEPLLVADLRAALAHTSREYTIADGGAVSPGPPPAQTDQPVTRSALFVPLRVEGQVVGVVQVQSYRLGAYTLEDQDLLGGLANVAAVAIRNARRVETRARSNEELRLHRERLEELVAARTAELSARVAEVERLNRALTNLLEDLQAANRRLEEAGERLRQANRELEAFSYSVSHDLRAPLRTIDGFSRIVIEEYGEQLPPEAQRYLELVQKGAIEMGQLIDDLLALSRLGRAALRKQEVAPEALVQQVLEGLAAEREGRQVEITIGPLPPCQADPSLLKEVWANLLSNALKYTRRREVARIEVSSIEHEGETAYLVRDNGVGFDMRYAEKLFGLFQRLHRAEEYEGTGVGLAIARRIVERHGGRIWAEAEEGKGATFCFTLP